LEEHFLGQSSAKEHCFLKKGNKVNFGLLSAQGRSAIIMRYLKGKHRQTGRLQKARTWVGEKTVPEKH